MRHTVSLCLLFTLVFIGCQKELSTELGTKSRGSLQEINGECLPKTVKGIYAVNRTLTDSNFLQIDLTVSAPGSYNISTDTANGYFFKGSGRLTTPGINTITLKGSGKPLQAGVDVFTIKYDSTVCTIQIAVDTAGGTGGGGTGGTGGTGGNPPTSTDMFPLTDGNTWTYWDKEDTTDTYTVTVRGTQTVGGRTYSRLVDSFGDTTFVRKDNGGTYWTAVDTADTDFAGTGIRFNTAILELPFLKQPLNQGANWKQDFPVTLAGIPIPFTISINFVCEEANTTLAYSGRSFTKVFRVKQFLSVPNAPPGTVPLDEIQTWYAQGIGRVQTVAGNFTEQLKSWNVR